VTAFAPRDPDFEPRVRASFAAQRVMRTIGASLARLAPGEVDINLEIADEFTQQNGFVHAGIVATIADSACGYAALSLMAPGKDVVSVEFKLNLLAPSVGDRLVARARVLRSGKTISVCRADVSALRNGEERLVATMLGTMMSVAEDPPRA
jgi:uncharacterized protein (TIGR00369 family)